MNTVTLNDQHGIKDAVAFSDGKGGLPVAILTNHYGSCIISLYGGHILSYLPKGQTEDIFWMSDTSAFEKGKAIRGGIPVCFPWFGPHATDSQKAVHGFARLLAWEVIQTNVSPDGSTKLILQLNSTPETLDIWPHVFKLTLTVTLGQKLNILLTIDNNGTEAFTCTDALHTYFKVSDLTKITIHGLRQQRYYAAGSNDILYQEEEDLLIQKEENRRYFEHGGICLITDNGWERKISVKKNGSNVTVVWNPHEVTAKNIGDMPDDGYKQFICVEAVNAYDDAVRLAPGTSWSLSQEIEAI